MKAAFVLGLISPFASLVAASPAADAVAQLEGRDPIICIGCVTEGSCPGRSEPSGCETTDNGANCDKYCYVLPPARCQCCEKQDDGTFGNCSQS